MFTEQIVSVLKFILNLLTRFAHNTRGYCKIEILLIMFYNFNAAGFKEFYKEAIYVEV